MHDLSNLTPPEGALRPRKRVGRGPGSGWGKTAGRGHKGLRSRSGGRVPAGFEGGQMPLHRRLPKRGFTNIFAKQWSIVNLADLEARFEDGAEVTPETLADAGLVWSRWVRPGEGKEKVREIRAVKILGRGELTKKLTIKANKFSRSAQEAIQAAGGTAEVI
jgi:large subunit ribosomal protein L15